MKIARIIALAIPAAFAIFSQPALAQDNSAAAAQGAAVIANQDYRTDIKDMIAANEFDLATLKNSRRAGPADVLVTAQQDSQYPASADNPHGFSVDSNNPLNPYANEELGTRAAEELTGLEARHHGQPRVGDLASRQIGANQGPWREKKAIDLRQKF